ncbi:matrixin family metalloprotease [Streptomyces decoyicus]
MKPRRFSCALGATLVLASGVQIASATLSQAAPNPTAVMRMEDDWVYADGTKRITLKVDEDSLTKSEMDAVDGAIGAWNTATHGVVVIERTSGPAHHVLTFENKGWTERVGAYLCQSQKPDICTDSSITLDRAFTDQARVTQMQKRVLVIHEIGHALGLNHSKEPRPQNGEIMDAALETAAGYEGDGGSHVTSPTVEEIDAVKANYMALP